MLLEEKFGASFFFPLPRAQGSRQVKPTQCPPLRYYFSPAHQLLSSRDLQDLEVEGALAAYIARPYMDTFLDGLLKANDHKNHLLTNWSLFSMARVMDILEAFLVRAEADGAVWLDVNVDIFSALEEEQPGYRAYLDNLGREEKASPDGTKKYVICI